MSVRFRIYRDEYDFAARAEAHGCTGKVRYGHEETAEQAKLHMEGKTGDKFDAYKCWHCEGWHIGHSRFAV